MENRIQKIFLLCLMFLAGSKNVILIPNSSVSVFNIAFPRGGGV